MTVPKGQPVLVVDDDPGVVDYLVEMLNEEGYQADGVTTPQEALRRLETTSYELVISDVEMPGMRGLDLMAAIHEQKPEQLVLLITAFGSIDLAVQAVRAGACDFVTKPFQIEVLFFAIERAFRERRMHREIVRLRSTLSHSDAGGLIARSPAMQRIVELARRVAATTATVLLTGESGVGKGAVARFIHDHSARRQRPFLQINCATLPAALVESELFGVRKGAYTDAQRDRDGLFVQAAEGTLFLDEIAEMPVETQAKLLQVLETNKVRPVGGTSETAVNVRVIAATNNLLEEALQDRRFRADLYHRLNVIHFDIPPLRERVEDIEPLVDAYLHESCVRLGHAVIGVSLEARRWLLTYEWPGNVRELANKIERAVALTEHDTLLLEDFLQPSKATRKKDRLTTFALRDAPLAEVEHAYIRQVLEVVQGNKARAARVLGIDRKTLYRKLGLAEPLED